MTEKEVQNVKAASMILRAFAHDDFEVCATVLNLEAQILSGTGQFERPLPILAGMLRGTINVIADVLNVIENIKED